MHLLVNTQGWVFGLFALHPGEVEREENGGEMEREFEEVE